MNKLLFIFTLLASISSAFARELISIEITADGRQDCKYVLHTDVNYDKELERSVKSTWSGRCTNGYLQGNGILKRTYPKGVISIYTAHYVNGKEEGPGTSQIIYPNGSNSFFSGTFHNGFQAQGTQTTTNSTTSMKSVYEGTFWNNERSGKGSLYLQGPNTHLKYVGDFLNNKRNGNGTIQYYDTGVTWSGPFTNDRMNGTGRYSTKDGEFGTAQFANGEKIYEQADPDYV